MRKHWSLCLPLALLLCSPPASAESPSAPFYHAPSGMVPLMVDEELVAVRGEAPSAFVPSTEAANPRGFRLGRLKSTARGSDAMDNVRPVLRVRDSGAPLVIGDEIIVRFVPGGAATGLASLLRETGGKITTQRERDPDRVVIQLPSTPALEVLALANRLHERPQIAYAQPNFYLWARKHGPPTDGLYGQQWHLHQIDAALGWTIQGNASSVTIAVLDDGVGFDSDLNRGAQIDIIDDDFDATPPCQFSHGHSCAALAGAEADGFNSVGVAPGAEILPVRIFGSTGATTVTAVVDGIEWAYSFQNADVLNLSWGLTEHFDISVALQNAASAGRSGKGAVIIAASGNAADAASDFPASHPDVISVGAVNGSDQSYNYSNWGVDVVAPSGNLPSGSIVTRGWDSSCSATNIFGYGGTSASCAQVAGLAALVLAKDGSLTRTQVRDLIRNYAYDLGGGADVGHGRIDVAATMAAMIGTDFSVSVTAPTGGATWSVGESRNITWNSCGTCAVYEHRVELSRNGGSTWTTIATVGGEARSTGWTVTGPTSTDCLIRVVAVNPVAEDSGQMGATFTIQPAPTIVSGKVIASNDPWTGLPDVTIELDGAPVATTDSNGDYSFPVSNGQSGTIVAKRSFHTMTPASVPFTASGSAVSIADISASADNVAVLGVATASWDTPGNGTSYWALCPNEGPSMITVDVAMDPAYMTTDVDADDVRLISFRARLRPWHVRSFHDGPDISERIPGALRVPDADGVPSGLRCYPVSHEDHRRNRHLAQHHRQDHGSRALRSER